MLSLRSIQHPWQVPEGINDKVRWQREIDAIKTLITQYLPEINQFQEDTSGGTFGHLAFRREFRQGVANIYVPDVQMLKNKILLLAAVLIDRGYEVLTGNIEEEDVRPGGVMQLVKEHLDFGEQANFSMINYGPGVIVTYGFETEEERESGVIGGWTIDDDIGRDAGDGFDEEEEYY